MGRFEYAFQLRLREILSRSKDVGLTKGRLAVLSGISQGTLNRWGHRTPPDIVKLDTLDAFVTGQETLVEERRRQEKPRDD